MSATLINKSELLFLSKISLIIFQLIQTTTTYLFQIILFIILYFRYCKPTPEVRHSQSRLENLPALIVCYISYLLHKLFPMSLS